MKVAIVTFEFEGLTRNAGIGTSFRRLADLLLAEGHEVTVVFLPVELEAGSSKASARWMKAVSRLRRQGITVVVPRDDRVQFQRGQIGYYLGRSNLVYRYLRSRRFDVVHAADNCALVYVSLQAKRAGKEFLHTEFNIGAHGPRIWGDELNGKVTPQALLMSYFDRCSVEMADRLISPSRYMIRYLRSRRWRLPKDVRMIPNVNRLGTSPPRSRAVNRTSSRARTIVFFGRLEVRKGVHLFVEAIRRLLELQDDLGGSQRLQILFLGRDPDPAQGTISLLRRRLLPLQKRLSMRFVSALSSLESQRLLSRMPEALICIPSLADNSPYTVVEGIEAGASFVTTRSGGQAELLHPADRARVLCKPDPDSLCRLLARRLKSDPIRVRPSAPAVRANREWIRLHARLPCGKEPTPRAVPRRPTPLVSVALTSMKALGSLLRQDYGNIEICVPRGCGWRVPCNTTGRIRFTEFDSRGTSHWLAASEAASGEYLLFLDAPLAGKSTLRDWVAAADAAGGNGSAQVATFGGAAPTNEGLSIESLALWNRRRLLQSLRKRDVDLADEREVHALFSSLFLSGERIRFFPDVVVSLSTLFSRSDPQAP